MIETKDLLKPFTEKGEKVVFVPGNWDESITAKFLSEQYGVKNIGEHYVKYNNVGIFGIGSENWQLSLDEEKTFKKLKKNIYYYLIILLYKEYSILKKLSVL